MSEGIWQKLAVAQGNMGMPQLDRVNPRFSSKYASLSSVLSCIKGPLNEQGLFFWNEVTREDGQAYMVTMVTDGVEKITIGKVEHVVANDSQKVGSALTYSKRQSLCAAFGIVGDEDDDANATTNQPKQYPKTPQPTQQPQPDGPVFRSPNANQQKITPEQWEQLINLFNGITTGRDRNEVWKELGMSIGFFPSQDMSVVSFNVAMDWLRGHAV